MRANYFKYKSVLWSDLLISFYKNYTKRYVVNGAYGKSTCSSKHAYERKVRQV